MADQAPESLPGWKGLTALQGILSPAALGVHVGVAFGKAVVIEVILRVPELAAQVVLCQAGVDDDLQGARTDFTLQGLSGDLRVIACVHRNMRPWLIDLDDYTRSRFWQTTLSPASYPR